MVAKGRVESPFLESDASCRIGHSDNTSYLLDHTSGSANMSTEHYWTDEGGACLNDMSPSSKASPEETVDGYWSVVR